MEEVNKMDKIIIQGTLDEELISKDYDVLYDILIQLGIENINIEINGGSKNG